MKRLQTYTLLVVCIALAAACGDSTSPDPTNPDSIAGTYVATTFTLSGDMSADVLDEGGSLTITLNADSTTSGNLFVPASVADGEELNESMVGTYSVVADTLTFNQVADTFVRDCSWIIEGSHLSASEEFSGVTITIVLARQ